MNSLKVKILGLITFIVVAIILVATFINFQLQKQMISSIMEHNSMTLAETVKSSIANAMNAGRAHELQDILFTAKNRESIKSIRIIDTTGTIIHSADSGEIGKIVSRNEIVSLQSRLADRPMPPPDTNAFATFSIIRNGPLVMAATNPHRKFSAFWKSVYPSITSIIFFPISRTTP